MKVGKRMIVFLIIILSLFLIFPDNFALAARRYLVASGNFNNTAIWSTTSGGSGGASVPGSDDHVILDLNSNECKVTLVGNVTIDSLDISAGTFDADSYYLWVNNDVNISGDSLLLGTSTGHIFRKNINLSGGLLNCGSSTWNLRGDLVITGGSFDSGTSTLVFNNRDAMVQNLSSNASINLYNVTIEQGSPDNEFAGVNFDNNSLNVVVFTINGTLKMVYPDQEGITLTASGSFLPPFLAYGSNSKLLYAGANQNSKNSQLTGSEFSATITVNDLEININPSYTNGVDISGLGNRTLRRNLTLTTGILTHGSNETISVGGTLSTGTLTTGGSYVGGTILMSGNQTQYIEAGTGSISNLSINKTTSINTVFLNTNILNITGILDIQNGIFELTPSANGLNLSSSSSVFRVRSGGTFRTGGKNITMASGSTFDLQTGSTFEFNGSAQEQTPSGLTFSNLVMNNSAGLNVIGNVVVNGTLTFAADHPILVTGGSNTLTFGPSASISGASSSKFIQGPMRKEFSGTGSFTYPIGVEDGGFYYYRPATFAYTAGTFGDTSILRIAYSRSSFTVKNLPAGISAIDQTGHYIVTELGTAPTNFTYEFTGTFDNNNFPLESRNRALVETTDSYIVATSNDVNETNNTVRSGPFSSLPMDNQFIVFGAGGTTITWDGGAGDGLWSSANNWNPDALPISTDDVIIDDNDATTVTIDGTTSAVAQTLTLGGTYSPTLIIAGTSSNPLRIYQTSGTPLTVNNNSVLRVVNSQGIKFDPEGTNQYDPDRTAYATTSTVEYQAGTVQADTYGNLIVNGATGSSTSGTIIVSGNFEKQGSSSFTASTDVSVAGTYTNQAGTATFNGNGLSMTGINFIVNGGSIGGTVTFAGSSAQTISGSTSPASFATLVLNNASGLTLNTPVQVSTALNLNNGLLNTASNLLTLLGTASATGNENSYVYGPLARTNTIGSKHFPIGKSVYRPVTTNLSGTSPVVQFEVFDTPPNQNFDAPLVRISLIRYWRGTLNSGSISGGQVTIEYGPGDGVQDGPDLRMAYSVDNTNANPYISIGGTGTGAGSGTITGTLPGTTLGYFTLGTVTLDNSLPVDLVAFNAIGKAGKVLLTWQTASEVNNSGFEIYRATSENGIYEPVNQQLIPGQGNSTTSHFYEYLDTEVEEQTTYYYKLYSRDFNGTRNVYEKISVATVLALPREFRMAQNYPNPFNPTTRLSFDMAKESRVSIEVYNMLGQKIRTLLDNERLEPGVYDHIIWDAKDDAGNAIANGIYYLVFTAKDHHFRQVRKMVFMK